MFYGPIRFEYESFHENIPENQSEIDQMSEKLVEQHRKEIPDMLSNHLIDVELDLKCSFLSDYYRLNKS